MSSGSAKVLDTAGPVRPGEELDAAALDRWLKDHVEGLEGAPTITQFSGGASNWTYRVAYPNRDLILRRPPAGTKAASAHDMGREYRVQKQLKPVLPEVPTMVAFCDDPAVIGDEFYVMERIAGIIPRRRMPHGVNLTPAQARQLGLNAVDLLVRLHRIDPAAVGLDDLGKGAGYNTRQIQGWADRYTRARTWNVPRFRRVIAWLQGRIPPEVSIGLVHNDFRLDNLILDPADPTRIIGILDWELATLGDPLMDLGNSLAYWVEADDDFLVKANARQPTADDGMLTRRELVDAYLERAGLDRVDFRFYEVYGLFRLAGIVQQIYYRYHHKQNRNPAFKHFWLFVHYLHLRCLRLIALGR